METSEAVLDDFHRSGAAMVRPLTREQVEDALAFLKAKQVFPGCHVRYAARPASTWEECLGEHVLCWHHADVLAAPHLLPLALRYSPIAASITGRSPPLLYSVNAFCTRPGGPLRPDIQEWHRDTDDKLFVPMFVFLTEGCTQEVRIDGTVTRITGPAGTAFFSNTMLDHRGNVPDRERIIFWARWGVSDKPASYDWDQLYPVPREMVGANYPSDQIAQEELRLLVA